MIIPHDYCGKGVLLRRVFVAILLTALEGLESFDRFENRIGEPYYIMIMCVVGSTNEAM